MRRGLAFVSTPSGQARSVGCRGCDSAGLLAGGLQALPNGPCIKQGLGFRGLPLQSGMVRSRTIISKPQLQILLSTVPPVLACLQFARQAFPSARLLRLPLKPVPHAKP